MTSALSPTGATTETGTHIQFTPGLITDDGEVTDESVAAFLQNYMSEFHGFISRVYTVLPRNA